MKKNLFFIYIFFCFVMILSCGTTSNHPPKDLFKPPMPPHSEIDAKLFEAVKNNDRAAVSEYLVKGNPNVTDRLGQSALMWACWYGNKDIVSALLKNEKKRVNVNAKSKYGYTALLSTAYTTLGSSENNLKIFNILLNSGATINAKDDNNENVLYKAVKANKYEFAKYILTNERFKNIDKNSRDSDGYTALHLATLQNNFKMVELLLKYNADAYTFSKQEFCPLYTAAENNSYLIFYKLLEKIAENTERAKIKEIPTPKKEKIEDYLANKKDKKFYEALKQAENGLPIDIDEYKKELDNFYKKIQNNASVEEIRKDAEIFLSDGVVADMQAYEERPPLLELAISNSNIDVLLYLLKNGVVHPNGKSLLLFACERKSYKEKDIAIMKKLIDCHTDFPQTNTTLAYPDIGGKTSLMHIIGDDTLSEEIGWPHIKKLLDFTKDEMALGLNDLGGKNLFAYVIENKSSLNTKVFDYLLNHFYKEGNIDGKVNDTPYVIYAYENNFYYAVEKLLDAHENNFVCTKKGKTLKDIVKSDLEKTSKPTNELQAILVKYENYEKSKSSLKNTVKEIAEKIESIVSDNSSVPMPAHE